MIVRRYLGYAAVLTGLGLAVSAAALVVGAIAGFVAAGIVILVAQ